MSDMNDDAAKQTAAREFVDGPSFKDAVIAATDLAGTQDWLARSPGLDAARGHGLDAARGHGLDAARGHGLDAARAHVLDPAHGLEAWMRARFGLSNP
jgi:hypothetical protein